MNELNVIKKLAQVANKLDQMGHIKIANEIDDMLKAWMVKKEEEEPEMGFGFDDVESSDTNEKSECECGFGNTMKITKRKK